MFYSRSCNLQKCNNIPCWYCPYVHKKQHKVIKVVQVDTQTNCPSGGDRALSVGIVTFSKEPAKQQQQQTVKTNEK